MIATPAGERNKRVTFQVPTRLSDGMGGFVSTTWADQCKQWAKIEAVSGSKSYETQQVMHGVTHTITTRYFSGATPDCRILFRGRVFAIGSMANVEECNQEIRWFAKEMTGE
jgi:SPP1 family predicted phage head-tail adaptor